MNTKQNTARRKQAHVDICLQEDVEFGATRLDHVHLLSHSIPHLALEDINTSTTFLGYKISMPLFISCMTGGAQRGAMINAMLSECAEQCKIPFGLGSIRILLENPKVLSDFSVRRYAPSIPILANLGVSQLSSIDYNDVFRMLEKLQVDCMVLHINPAQELSQIKGATDFKNTHEYIRVFTDRCPLPVIVKETGYGILPQDVELLLGYGVRYVDIAGSGGTNWAKVEHIYNDVLDVSHAPKHPTQSLYHLGYPTGLLMLALCDHSNIIASGGIRNALDMARCLVLGATHVGIALPIISRVMQGKEVVVQYIMDIQRELKNIMLLCGVSDISEMSSIPFWLDHGIQLDIVSFARSLNLTLPERVRSNIAIL